MSKKHSIQSKYTIKRDSQCQDAISIHLFNEQERQASIQSKMGGLLLSNINKTTEEGGDSNINIVSTGRGKHKSLRLQSYELPRSTSREDTHQHSMQTTARFGYLKKGSQESKRQLSNVSRLIQYIAPAAAQVLSEERELQKVKEKFFAEERPIKFVKKSQKIESQDEFMKQRGPRSVIPSFSHDHSFKRPAK